jgi:ankyrin repeat protein
MYACQRGHLESLKVFLPFLADVKTVHRALGWAAEAGELKLVSEILQHPGVNVNNTDHNHVTPLYLATGAPANGHLIKYLLDAGADASFSIDYPPGSILSSRCKKVAGRSYTCMHQLCNSRDRSDSSEDGCDDLETIFRLLVDAGVSIQQPTPSGDTPLHGALSSRILTRLLIDAGANPNAKNDQGKSPLDICRSPELLTILFESSEMDINAVRGSGRTLLQEKLLSCGNDTIFKLLEYRPDCTITDREGNGVLHAALSCCLTVPKIIEALLENGADPNLRNQQGQAPAHLLVQSKSSNWLCILDLLLKAGADINATDRQGLSIFFQFIAKKTFSNFRSNPHQDLQNLLDRGASPTIRDLAGRTCLHVAIEHNNDSSRMRSDKSDSRFDFLVGLGLDIFSLDHRGNGLLHELAVFKTDYEPTNNRMLMERWKQLVDSGLDINQKNYYARTPLHLLCSSVTERTLARRGELMVIDFVIERTADINACDLDGLTPLHMAVTKSEFYTKRLLDAGANPAALAHNGMTPLHLACDAEKSNIVGILLDALRNCNTSDLLCEEVRGTSSEIGKVSSSQSLRRQKSVPGINARIYEGEAVGYTPLFLACRSGKPETVALLLEAGASVVLSDDSQACGIPLYLVADTSLIDACRAFEGLENSRNYHHIWTCENVLSGTAAPCKRRRMPSDSYGFTESHTRRIDEIMDMIIRNGADLSYFGSNRDGVLQALAGENSYASRCFGTAVQNNRDVLASGEELERIIQMFKLQSTAAPSIKSLEDLGCLKPGESNEDLFRKLMVRKEYQLVEKLAELGADFLAGPNSSSSNFGILVRHGFASLVEKIGSLESKRNHGKGKWHAFGDPTKPGLWLAERDLTHSLRTGESLTPFIVDAVRRRSPSIRLLRCLVEVLAVDINEMCYKAISVDSERKMVSEETPLLAAASGTVWWHVYQALPYLLKAGADMSIRNMYGHSALHVALLSDGIWSDEAAKALIEAGADVNALDNVGRSCLASVQHNVGLIKLLVQHGAIVTAEAVFAAIESGNIEALEALLSTGVNADIRRHHTYDPEDEDDVIIRGVEEQGLSIYSDAAEARGQTPLHFAALKAAPQKQPQMVRVLLDHGADPLATFLKRSNRDKYSSSVLEGYKERIVWHDLLLQGASALPLSCLTSLDVNRRDAKGRTLLHVACESKEGPDHCIELSEVTNSDDKTTIFKHLLSLGADINAIDKRGRNVIHFMMCCRLWAKYEVIKDSLAWTINTVPDLMHQADIDGMRPLHHAIIRATVKEGTDTIRVLLDRGADPRPTTNEGRSCLHLLAMVLHQASMLELFGDLVKQGVDVNGRDKDGRTPVFFFYRRSWKPNSRRLASELIRDPSGVRLPTNKTFTEKDFVTNFKNLGVDFFVKDNKGQGLLHIAAATGQFEPFKELMDLGLDVMMEDNDQRTPIDIAATYGNHEVMRLFDKTR